MSLNWRRRGDIALAITGGQSQTRMTVCSQPESELDDSKAPVFAGLEFKPRAGSRSGLGSRVAAQLRIFPTRPSTPAEFRIPGNNLSARQLRFAPESGPRSSGFVDFVDGSDEL